MNLLSTMKRRPNAIAEIYGDTNHPDLYGTIRFYQTNIGVIVMSEIVGLPDSVQICNDHIFAFHIHQGGACRGNDNDYFADALSHYNPNFCPHPFHAGDMPPLFGVNGMAFSVFLTDRFSVNEIIGRTIIIHDSVDDFTSQPSGNSGKKIACGVIKGYHR